MQVVTFVRVGELRVNMPAGCATLLPAGLMLLFLVTGVFYFDFKGNLNFSSFKDTLFFSMLACYFISICLIRNTQYRSTVKGDVYASGRTVNWRYLEPMSFAILWGFFVAHFAGF